MQRAVGGQRVAAMAAFLAGDGGEAPACLAHHRHQGRHVVELQFGFERGVHRALGQQRIGVEVAVAAGAPGGLQQLKQPVELAGILPAVQRGVGQRRVGQLAHPGDADLAGGGGADLGARLGDERAQPGGRVPAAGQRRGGDDPEHRLVVDKQRDQRGPHRHAAHEVLGPVDRVDDPAARGVPVHAELLAEHGVLRAVLGQLREDQLLGAAVGVGDRVMSGLVSTLRSLAP